MYDKVNAQKAASGSGAASASAGRPARGRRDWPLGASVAVAVAIMALLIAGISIAVRLGYRHSNYIQDLSSSFAHGERHDSLRIDAGEGRQPLADSRATRLFTVISDAGMGKPSDAFPEDQGIELEFGDGCMLGIWPVTLEGGQDGVLLRYTCADGEVFAYDTDRLTIEDVRQAAGL